MSRKTQMCINDLMENDSMEVELRYEPKNPRMTIPPEDLKRIPESMDKAYEFATGDHYGTFSIQFPLNNNNHGAKIVLQPKGVYSITREVESLTPQDLMEMHEAILDLLKSFKKEKVLTYDFKPDIYIDVRAEELDKTTIEELNDVIAAFGEHLYPDTGAEITVLYHNRILGRDKRTYCIKRSPRLPI